jgi:hypothetical protein
MANNMNRGIKSSRAAGRGRLGPCQVGQGGQPAMAGFDRLFMYDIHRYSIIVEKPASTSTFSILNLASSMSSNGFFGRTKEGVDQIVMEMMDSDEADLSSGVICNKPTCSNCICNRP